MSLGRIITLSILGFNAVVLLLVKWRSGRMGKKMFYDPYADDTPPEAKEAFECLSCGAMIPTGAPLCPHCGWTFKK
jgi:hypothetical protein